MVSDQPDAPLADGQVELIDLSGPAQPGPTSAGGGGIRSSTAAWALVALVVAGAVILTSWPGSRASNPAPRSAPERPVATTIGGSEPASVPTRPDRGPLARFDPDLPADLPGIISGFDVDGSLIVVDRSRGAPEEVRLGLRPGRGYQSYGLGLGGGEPIWFTRPMAFTSAGLTALGRSGPVGPAVDLKQLGSSSEVLVVTGSATSQTAAILSLDGLTTREDAEWRWELASGEARILGLWKGRLVVYQAAQTWLMSLTGLDGISPATVVAEGQVLGFDGRHLVRQRCQEPARCGLVIGTPDDPHGATLPPPVSSAGEVGRWLGPVAVSPDGRWVAAAVSGGPEAWIMVADLADGTTMLTGENAIGSDTRLAWSPDGGWLAYQVGDDLRLRATAGGRTWTIQLGRRLASLMWAVSERVT